MQRRGSWLITGLLGAAQLSAAYTLDFGSTDSLQIVASSMTEDMMSFYTGDQPGQVPGLLPQPYYWWEAGAMMGSLIDYWYYTGDTRWNNVTSEGLLFQVGPNNDYMPPNQTVTEGNDDQGFWGMAAMSAAEYNFDNPPPGKPQWLSLAQAVFNTQAARWNSQDCGGGLRWQIFTFNNGYDYKNSISQACFFSMAARLARYTGNQSYAEWADRTWDWMVSTKLLDSEYYYVYDGVHTDNCSDITPYQWTYNAGAFLLGAAAMYNFTTGPVQQIWRDRVDSLLNGTLVFFTGENKNIMTEVACEPVNLCDLDQQSFKAYLSRWMAATTKWAPWTYDRIKSLLESSAAAAASTCIGGSSGRLCGLKWAEPGKWDGSSGVGQQMAAMEVVLGNMIKHVSSPVTNDAGGTSIGNPGAGGSDVGRTDPFHLSDTWAPISAGSKAGAYILTILAVAGLTSGCIFVLFDEKSKKSPGERFSELRAVVITAGGSRSSLDSRNKARKFSATSEKGGKEGDDYGFNRSDSDRTLQGGGSEPDRGTEVEPRVASPRGDDVPIIKIPSPRDRKPSLKPPRTKGTRLDFDMDSSLQKQRESYWKNGTTCAQVEERETVAAARGRMTPTPAMKKPQQQPNKKLNIKVHWRETVQGHSHV